MDKRSMDILLIEDDPDDAELTILSLRKNNVINSIHHIDDGEKALEYLFCEEHVLPQVILLDLRMPKIDGIQILKRLKADPIKKSVPVIVMISSREGKNYLESHQVKADAYVVKPVDSKKFLAAIAELGMGMSFQNSTLYK